MGARPLSRAGEAGRRLQLCRSRDSSAFPHMHARKAPALPSHTSIFFLSFLSFTVFHLSWCLPSFTASTNSPAWRRGEERGRAPPTPPEYPPSHEPGWGEGLSFVSPKEQLVQQLCPKARSIPGSAWLRLPRGQGEHHGHPGAAFPPSQMEQRELCAHTWANCCLFFTAMIELQRKGSGERP